MTIKDIFGEEVNEMSFEDYLREAESCYHRVMDAGCDSCGECELSKMGFDDNFIITTTINCNDFYQGLLRTGEFRQYNDDSYRGQYGLVHLVGCTHLGMAKTGEEWYFGKEVGHKTDIVLGPLSKDSALAMGLNVTPVLRKNKKHICAAKSVFYAVNGIFRFAKRERVPLIGGFMKFGGFVRGWPYREENAPKLVYNPDK